MARGKKICDKCGESNGVRTLKCKNCNTEFSLSSKKKEKKELTLKQQKILKSIEEVPIEIKEEVKITHREHAERILSYGKERATILLRLAKWSSYWKHVDWDVVKEGI